MKVESSLRLEQLTSTTPQMVDKELATTKTNPALFYCDSIAARSMPMSMFPASPYQQLLQAESKGPYFNSYLRDRFETVLITPESRRRLARAFNNDFAPHRPPLVENLAALVLSPPPLMWLQVLAEAQCRIVF